MFHTTRHLSDKHKHIHELCAPYLKELGVIDLGNHFEIYSYISNNPLMIEFLKEECAKYKKENFSGMPNVYTYLDEIADDEYSPKLIFIDKDYIVDIGCDCRISVYNHDFKKVVEYKHSQENFQLGFVSSFNPPVYMNQADEHINIQVSDDFTISADIKTQCKFSTFDNDIFDSIQNIEFKKDTISAKFPDAVYSNIIFDYDFNIVNLKFNRQITKDLNITSSFENTNSYESIIELLAPNMEMFFLENDYKYQIDFDKEELEDHIKIIKKLCLQKDNMKKTFSSIKDTINLKEQLKPFSDKRELLVNYTNVGSYSFNMTEEINKKYVSNRFFSDNKTMKNYHRIIATLCLLKEKNDHLIDYQLIDKILHIESITDKFIKNYNTEITALKNKI